MELPPPPAETSMATELPPGVGVPQLMTRLNDSALDFLEGGAESPGRHTRTWATMKNLQEAGVCAADALRLTEAANALSQPPLPQSEVTRIWRQVYNALPS